MLLRSIVLLHALVALPRLASGFFGPPISFSTSSWMPQLRSRDAGFAMAAKKRLVKEDDEYNDGDDDHARSVVMGPMPIPVPTKMATKLSLIHI